MEQPRGGRSHGSALPPRAENCFPFERQSFPKGPARSLLALSAARASSLSLINFSWHSHRMALGLLVWVFFSSDENI